MVVIQANMANTATKNSTKNTIASVQIPEEQVPEVAIGRLVSFGSVPMHEQSKKSCVFNSQQYSLHLSADEGATNLVTQFS